MLRSPWGHPLAGGPRGGARWRAYFVRYSARFASEASGGERSELGGSRGGRPPWRAYPSRIRIPKNSEERVSRPISLVNLHFLALAGRPAETICTKSLRVVFAMPKTIRRFTFHACRWVICCEDSGTRKSRTCQFA